MGVLGIAMDSHMKFVHICTYITKYVPPYIRASAVATAPHLHER